MNIGWERIQGVHGSYTYRAVERSFTNAELSLMPKWLQYTKVHCRSLNSDWALGSRLGRTYNWEWKWGMCQRDNPTKEQKTALARPPMGLKTLWENLIPGGGFSWPLNKKCVLVRHTILWNI